MRVQKSRSVYKEQELVYPQLTEPNQAFTPRQIIDQFSRGELSAKSFEPSDSIDDGSFSDDVMVDHTIEFEDEFSALEYMNTTKVKRNKKDNDDRREKPAQEGKDKTSEGPGAEEG